MAYGETQAAEYSQPNPEEAAKSRNRVNGNKLLRANLQSVERCPVSCRRVLSYLLWYCLEVYHYMLVCGILRAGNGNNPENNIDFICGERQRHPFFLDKFVGWCF